MPGTQEQENIVENENAASTTATTNNQADADMVAKLVEERVAADLKSIKDKLDNAYSLRDAAVAKAAEYERKEREAELQRLKEEGKHQEAYNLQLAEKDAKLAQLEKANRELSRDVHVKDSLKGLNFRNDKASDMAYAEIVQQLVQDENGVWVHRSGVSIKDFVTAFSANEDNAFLFKVKANTGGGSGSVSANGDTSSANKSLFSRTQAEVLQLAAEGKLPRQRK
jgi:hypothetical protein